MADHKDLLKLKTCLENARVFDDLITWITKDPPDGLGLEALEDLVHIFDAAKYEEQSRELLQKNEKYKEDGRALSRLRTAWCAAKKSVDMETPTNARKTKDGETEDVIPDKDAEGLAKRWDNHHKMVMSIYLRPADSLMAKIWKEIQRNEHTVHTAKKIRSIFQATLPNAEESVELKPGVTMEFDKETVTDPQTVVEYYAVMRTLAFAYIYCGSHEVQSSKEPSKKVIYAPFDTNLDYCDESLRYADARSGAAKEKVAWLQKRDEATRSVMVGYMRRGWPQGEALATARLELQIEWKLLVPAAQIGQQRDRTRSPKRQQRSNTPPKTARMAPNQRQSLVDYHNNNLICKRYNESRGCTLTESDCPIMRSHVCDIDVGGRACGSKKHSRVTCPHRA